MNALLKVCKHTNLNVDQILENHSEEWFLMMLRQSLQMEINEVKMFSLGMRLPYNEIEKLEAMSKVKQSKAKKTNEFGDDIRLFESLGGTIEKIPKKKGKKCG